MLTHIDQKNLPSMVDISQKETSIRVARAQSIIALPDILKEYFIGGELVLKKGPVFQTAIIAATMAAKRTAEVIPFCHQIPLDTCKVDIQLDENFHAVVTVVVKTSYKTGVEMEALYAASVATLTIYDMCKAVGHSDLKILSTELLEKSGGKSDFKKN
jgi:cyclic pyranopterin phosphate synthase